MAIIMTWPQYLRGECTVSGFTVKLTEYEVEALMLLMLRGPNPVSKEEMIDWLWPNPVLEPKFTESLVYHTIKRLRAKVGEFHIPSRVTFGYRLLQEPEAKRPPQRAARIAEPEYKLAA